MCALLFAAIFAQLLRKSISKILTNAAEIACQGTVYLRAKSRRCAAVALRNAPAGAVTLPYRWLRAAHKIAPNGAWLPDVSYYRLDRTERSRPFPTNSPKVRNHPIRFIDSLHLPPKGKAFLLYLYLTKPGHRRKRGAR